jgi:hypothetical protein
MDASFISFQLQDFRDTEQCLMTGSPGETPSDAPARGFGTAVTRMDGCARKKFNTAWEAFLNKGSESNPGLVD